MIMLEDFLAIHPECFHMTLMIRLLADVRHTSSLSYDSRLMHDIPDDRKCYELNDVYDYRWLEGKDTIE